MGVLSTWIWLIIILGKGGGGGRRNSRRKVKVRRCQCGGAMVLTSGSSYRCQNCSPDLGAPIAKSVDSPDSGGGELAG
jgi:hypothetical protein